VKVPPGKAAPIVLIAISAFVGCGPREIPRPATYAVAGVVLLNGEPVRFAAIRLIPVNSPASAPADGYTDEEGAFQLRTYSNIEPDGAVPGTYRVHLQEGRSIRPLDPGVQTPTKLPAGDFDTGIQVEIEAQQNELTIEIP
jgi:hypothetical protein